jgi:ADP-ribosylglycohydrolase
MLSRAQGCFMGQLIGDSLGSLVEFKSPDVIHEKYPDGVRELAVGAVFHGLLPGQPTDDSEMALSLARTLVRLGKFDKEAVRNAYVDWIKSGAFDVGTTVANALRGMLDPESQANGAMMRVSPLAIWCAGHGCDFLTTARLASEDADITHINKTCKDANVLFVSAIVDAIRTPHSPDALYDKIERRAKEIGAKAPLLGVIENARDYPPKDYMKHMGWVLIAFQNALYQLLHAPSFEEALVDTVMRGGDTDTNAAICGALLGAVYGLDSIPIRWRETVLNCRPSREDENVRVPRPERFWPVDALELAEKLMR